MSYRHDTELVPRNGHTLVVGIVARISGCATQKEISLDDQVDHGKQEVADLYSGPVEYRVIATKGKGERLDRPELQEIEDMLRSRELDLLVAEDIGRMIRGTEAGRLCGIAVDHGTRVIAPNDCIDTAEDSWEEDVISACRDHVGHNAHTSKRIKHKMMNRFQKFGGATANPIAGYIKPEGAKTYADWRRDDEATETIVKGLRMLGRTLNCSAVADWFNQLGFPTGPYQRSQTWDGKMVRRYYQNRLLAGFPGRGFRHTIKHHETGRRIAVENPKGPTYHEFPHLAHVDVIELDEVNSLVTAANANYCRKRSNGVDPFLHRPRKRTRFPGQHARCWYCGRNFVWGGNGVTANLMCCGARSWLCWNSVGFRGTLAAERLMKAITSELYKLDGFDAQFAKIVGAAAQDLQGNFAKRWEQLRRDEEKLAQENKNLAEAIVAYGKRPLIENKLLELEEREKQLAAERYRLESRKRREPRLPVSIDELRRSLEGQFQQLAMDSPEFGELMRELAPDFHVYLVRLRDGGHLLPRARVRLDLSGSIADVEDVPELKALLSRVLTIDLFDCPPQRERIRLAAVEMAAAGLTQRQIAARLEERPKLPAVQKALALDREMTECGLDSPYVTVLEPPDDYAKLRRYENPRYRFEPLEDYQQPAI